jgi:hypothetical protein
MDYDADERLRAAVRGWDLPGILDALSAGARVHLDDDWTFHIVTHVQRTGALPTLPPSLALHKLLNKL